MEKKPGKGKKPINGVLSHGILLWQSESNLTKELWEALKPCFQNTLTKRGGS